MARLTTVRVGGLETNCYILAPDSGGECAVIDPGAEPQRIIDEITAAGLTVRYILSTHGHADHTGAATGVQDAAGGQYYLDAADIEYSLAPPEWLTAALGGFAPPPPPDPDLADAQDLPLGDGSITLIRTPGHTPGSTCYMYEDILFTGDTLFRESVGRYDLPGGDGRQEIESIKNRLFVLDGQTRVLPGHGPASTIEHEKSHNPFLQ